MPSMNDVAAVAGTSRYTVSKVINGSDDVREVTRKRVLDACRQLNYTPNLNAVNLVRGDSRTIGLITPQITDTFFGEVISAAERTAHAAGYQLVYECSYDDAEIECRIINSLKSLRVSGIIAAPVVGTSNQSVWSETESLFPVVYFDRYLHNKCHFVITDNRLSAYLATSHLLESGVPVAYLGSSHSTMNNAIRFRNLGYEQAVTEARQEPLFIPTDRTSSTNDDFLFGFENMEAYLKTNRPPKAVFCATDRIALGAMRALFKEGLSVGDDVLIAGHDDLDFSAYSTPSLTTVTQSKARIGQKAIESVLALVKVKNKTDRKIRSKLKPELIVRESSVSRISRK